MKKARQAWGYTQKSIVEIIGIDTRYLANIENSGSLPSLPVFHEIVRWCKLPVERYFHPEAEEMRDSEERAKCSYKRISQGLRKPASRAGVLTPARFTNFPLTENR